ncbi:MAG TPA: DUF6036 family nucleotidyltransferase [Polyangiaceae bacterium]|nr:DUF6036 family nucleotidyltransferase [Polyangiaceae bacterium]
MPSAASSTLADVARALESLGVRWYLFGAQAAIHYGSPRVTADVDVTVELAAVTPATLVASLRAVGIEPRFEFDEVFVARARVLPMIHVASGMGVDVVVAGPGPEEEFLERARQIRFEGVTIPIASPNDIVVMKMLAGRAKDLEDVVGILRATPEDLDVGEIRALLAELEQILGQSDLVPPFDDALRRARIR